ncbi:hypothetical protein [Metallibacterium scheffleri]|nr:hypothetical protein [Metallibacterium scheffleri]
MSEKKPMNKARKVLLATVVALALGGGGFWYAQNAGLPGSVNGALARPQMTLFRRPMASGIAKVKAAVAAPGPASTATASTTASPMIAHSIDAQINPGAQAAAPHAVAMMSDAAAHGAVDRAGNDNADVAVVDPSFFENESMLQRQLRILKLKEQISTIQAKLDKINGGAPAVAAKGPTVTVAAAPPTPGGADATTKTVSSVSLPTLPALPQPPEFTLKSVLGVGSQYTAVISAHGMSQAVHVGDHLGHAWTVTSIWPRHVVLTRGHDTKIVRLGG